MLYGYSPDKITHYSYLFVVVRGFGRYTFQIFRVDSDAFLFYEFSFRDIHVLSVRKKKDEK